MSVRRLTHATALAVALAAKIRVLSEAQGGSVTLAYCGQTLFHVPPATSVTVDVDCAAQSIQVTPDFAGLPASVSVAGFAAGTLLVTSNSIGVVATVVPDATELLPNGIGSIDQCALRVLNGAPDAVNVNWGSSNCVGCARVPAFLFPIPPGGAGPADGSYNAVACPYALAIDVSVAGNSSRAAWPTISAVMREHGEWSVWWLVRSSGGAAGSGGVPAAVG